jgi:Ca-activated chloride channel homolog
MTRQSALLAALLAPAVLAADQPTFSSRVEGVRVDVLVTDSSRRPLRGLSPADFELRDNGVLQVVDVVSYGEISLNVALAFDLSGSVAGERLARLRAASGALVTGLQKGDQTALVTFDRVVALPCPLSGTTACIAQALAARPTADETALIDGVYAGMAIGESDVGRSLLMVFSDGIDTASWLRAERVLETGRRSDVVVYAIASNDSRPEFLDELTSLTGGRLYEVGRGDDLGARFRSILDEFRHRYLVTYRPQGVTRGGWHRLDVRVKRSGATVKARPGYQG